jgi:hypothetical protein
MTLPGVAIRCFTNLDEYKSVDWPTRLAAVPEVGQRIEGRRGDRRPRLRIVAMCWLHNGELEVELHR